MGQLQNHCRVAAALLAACASIATAPQAAAAAAAPPFLADFQKSGGFSPERLANLHAILQDEIQRGALAGAVTILARHGQILDYQVYGQRDLASHAPMTKDTIFRDYSMTKPITGVAMMILYEQGKWLPQDPIGQHIPELAHLKVLGPPLIGGLAGGETLRAPDHAPTLRELMSHTAGFSYGNSPLGVDPLYQKAQVLQSGSLQEMINKLAGIPLDYQPGTHWKYSLSMDIEGYLIEKLSGQSLPDFMSEHIFKPLGMKDTGFYVPADKRARFATNYRLDAQQHLTALPDGDYNTQPGMPSGGGGLVSTAEDYYRFAQMLANGGVLEGRRILSPATVHLMMSNKLTDDLLTGQFGIGQHVMRPGFGYGFNGAVIFEPGLAALPDGPGTYFWDGAAGTWFWVDPANDVVFVGMIQRMQAPDNHALLYRSHAAVYSALVEPR